MRTERPTCRECACIKVCEYFQNENERNLDEVCPLCNWENYFVPKQEWISVEERLPDVDYYDYVLAWDGYNINFLHYSQRRQQWEDYCSMKKHHWDVTHWMPLPMPPKGDEGR